MVLALFFGGHIAGFIIAVAGVTVLGIYAGRMVNSAQDFSVGGYRASAAVVTGTIMGTLWWEGLLQLALHSWLLSTACAPGGLP